MNHWRSLSKWPNWILAPARNWHMEISCKLAETSSFDCRSSQLSLLLGMVITQQNINVDQVFATGELNNTHSRPLVEPVGGLAQKIDAILNYIAQEQPLHPILIALPKLVDPQKDTSGPENHTERRFSRRINSFLQQHRSLDITVIYCDDLIEDLSRHYPEVATYRHFSAYLKWLFLTFLLILLYSEYSKPLYLNWDNKQYLPDQYEINRPLRASLISNDKFKIMPLCSESRPGEDVFSSGDLILFNIRVDDHSWLHWISRPQTALVLIGEKSGVRVENLYQSQISPYLFQTAFAIEAQAEKYLVVGIAQKDIAINKGTLNEELSKLVKNLHGIERLTTVAGFLENKFDSVLYRFQITTLPCGETR